MGRQVHGSPSPGGGGAAPSLHQTTVKFRTGGIVPGGFWREVCSVSQALPRRGQEPEKEKLVIGKLTKGNRLKTV